MIKSQNNKTLNLTQSILDDTLEFWIQRPQILIQFQLSDELSVVNRNRLIQKTIFFGGHYLKFGEDKFLDVRNLFLEIVYHPRTSQPGFRLSKNGEKLDVYGDIQNWVEVLKKYTIQTNLQQKYKIIKKIAEGSQFQVFKIRNKLTGQENAVKILQSVKLVLDIPNFWGGNHQFIINYLMIEKYQIQYNSQVLAFLQLIYLISQNFNNLKYLFYKYYQFQQ